MSQSGWTWSPGTSFGGGGGGGGGRRQKVYGYLRAANELRQNYTTQLSNSIREISSDEYTDVPGAYPDDGDVQHSGGEQLLLFPSYVRRVGRKKSGTGRGRGRSADLDSYRYRGNWTGGFDDEDYSYYGRGEGLEGDNNGYGSEEDENAIVKANVHGWLYIPHRGQMARKQRLMVGLARKLSGIPVPNSTNAAESGDRISGTSDEDVVNKQAQLIMDETDKSRGPTRKDGSLEESGDRRQAVQRSTTAPPSLQASQMTQDELVAANNNLMKRLRPFLAHAVVDMPVSVFFYNDEQSQQRSAYTDEFGHFLVRAGLHFVPTHIRVLASDGLSVTREVRVTEPAGVSLISDIDDTVKHSGIALGAKEVCRNTFVRDIHDLVVNGVGQWYGKLASMGVQFHYVSNSPWQIYSLLETYFKVAGLPAGSFHLKQYNGMLQGLFESAAEKKKSSLERVLRDFPERKFVLVGDSGEADLEVYTEIVLTHPGRILGVFIRDVTTPERKPAEKPVDRFQPTSFQTQSASDVSTSSSAMEKRPVLPPPFQTQSTSDVSASSSALEKRPPLPPRKPREPPVPAQKPENAELIDLRDEPEEPSKPAEVVNGRRPPAKPTKPTILRTATTNSVPAGSEGNSFPTQTQTPIRRKPAPPPPRRVGSTPSLEPGRESANASRPTQNNSPVSSGKNSVASVQLNLNPSTDELPVRPKPKPQQLQPQQQPKGPPRYGELPRYGRTLQAPPAPPPRRTNTGTLTSIPTPTPTISSTTTTTTTSSNSSPTRLPPRHQTSPQPPQKPFYPAAAASAAFQYTSDRLPTLSSSSSSNLPSLSNMSTRRTNTNTGSLNGTGDADSSSSSSLGPNRREETWRRRWERAKEILDDQGVILASWRVGGDVQDVCVWLVKEALDCK